MTQLRKRHGNGQATQRRSTGSPQAPTQLVFSQCCAGFRQLVGNVFRSASLPWPPRKRRLSQIQAPGRGAFPSQQPHHRTGRSPNRRSPCLRLPLARPDPRAMSVNLDKATFTSSGSRALTRSSDCTRPSSQVLAGRVKVEGAAVGSVRMGAKAKRLKDRKVGTHFSTVGAGQAGKSKAIGSSED